MKRVSQRRLFFLFFAYLRTYKLTDMKKLILLIVLAAAAYGVYKIWISDGEVLNDYIGEENVMKAKDHLSALTDKPATADTATIAANWFATGPAVYLKSGNAVGNLSGEAVAAIAENRLTPYYEQLQLDDTHIEFSDETPLSSSCATCPWKDALTGFQATVTTFRSTHRRYAFRLPTATRRLICRKTATA